MRNHSAITSASPGRRTFRTLALALAIFSGVIADASALTFGQKLGMLSSRDRTFLDIVFSGNAAKSVEYVRTAGVNPNSIGGEPLSTWFYAVGPVANINVQKIVFESFRQNPNPPNALNMEFLSGFCNLRGLPDNIRVAVEGSPAEKAALQQRLDNARRAQVDEVMASFNSLVRYGLKDKDLLTGIFVGCMSHRMIPKTAEYYERVFSPMLKAGANVDGMDNRRPLQMMMQEGNPDMVERLVADGADVVYHIPSPTGLPYGQGPCQPRVDQTLYRYVFDYARTRNEDAAVRIVRVLASKGLSPMTKWGVGAGAGCKYTTFYDAVVDTGNLAYAARIKEIGDNPGRPVTTRPATPTAAGAPSAPSPSAFGAWRVASENGTLVAVTSAAKADADHLAGLRFECVAPGRLEYAPVASRNAIRTLWVNGMDDVQHTIPLTAGHATGADASLLSKEFLGSEANYKRSGQNDWSVGMSIDGPEAFVQEVRMTGFSQMRSYMLANCKKQG